MYHIICNVVFEFRLIVNGGLFLKLRRMVKKLQYAISDSEIAYIVNILINITKCAISESEVNYRRFFARVIIVTGGLFLKLRRIVKKIVICNL